MGLDALVPKVVEFTRPFLERGLVALYLHGSCAGGQTDAWSDVDVAGICAGEEARRELFSEWAMPLEKRFEHRVDPVVASRAQLHEGGEWHAAFLRDSLLTRAELLLGEEVRAEVAPVTEHLARLAAVLVAMTWLRRLYDTPRFYPFPERLEGRRAEALEGFDRGNAAWQLATAVTRLTGAVLLLETGASAETRGELREAAAGQGWTDAADWLGVAIGVRKEFSRFGEVDASAPALIRLAEAVPTLAARLFEAMGRCGIVDPTLEGRTGGAYEADGTLKPEPPEPFELSEPPG